MKKYLPFALLIPALMFLGLFLASLLGFEIPYGTPLSSLLGAATWTLLFLRFKIPKRILASQPVWR